MWELWVVIFFLFSIEHVHRLCKSFLLAHKLRAVIGSRTSLKLRKITQRYFTVIHYKCVIYIFLLLHVTVVKLGGIRGLSPLL